LKVSSNVKIVMQCFENFGGDKCPHLVARLPVNSFGLRLWNIMRKRSCKVMLHQILAKNCQIISGL